MAQENKNTNPEKGAAGNKAVPSASTVLNDDTRVVVEAQVSAVYYTCPITFETFAWIEAGDTQEMTYKQLRVMNTKHPRYFAEKWILPRNEEVLKKLNLTKYYTNKVNRADVGKLFGSDVTAVRDLISGLDSTAKEELTQTVIQYVKSGRIENVKMIRLLEKKLGVELMDLV